MCRKSHEIFKNASGTWHFTGVWCIIRCSIITSFFYTQQRPWSEASDFDRNQKSLIGHSIDSYPGHSDINNINHSMMSSNYIQNIWQNILSVISTEDGESTKRIGVKED